MKRKMFLIVISVLVLCLTCGMLFVACNDKNDNNDNTDDDHNTTTGSAFDTFKDVVFELEDVKLDTTGAKEFNFGLDVTAADDASKSLFSLAFETLGGEEYIYGSVNGGAMTKFNGFDLGGTVETVLSWFGDSISIKGIPVELNANGFLGGVGGELLSALIGDAKVSSDGSAYAIVLNLEGIVGIISGEDAFLNLDQVIADAGLGDIFGMIIPAIGGLITPDGSDDASPATVTELVEAIADNYTLTFYFGFEDNTGKDAAAEKAAQPFGDLALSSKVMAARGADAQNLLNFKLDGTAELKDAEGKVTGRYDIDVDIDLDIFPLIPAILDCVTTGPDENGNMMPNGFVVDDEKLEGIISAVKEMGYISIEVNELNLDDNSLKKNILTIHSNFDEGNAIVQLYGESILIISVGIGGAYDFEALGDYIVDMVGGAVSQADGNACEHVDEDGDGICDKCKEEMPLDIMALIGDILALTNLNTADIEGSLTDINANGFTIKMSGLMDVIDTVMDVDADVALGMTLRDLLPDLWKEADTLTIKIETALEDIYGTAVKKDTAELYAMKSSPSKALVSEITSIEGLPTDILDASGIIAGLDQAYTMKGISIATGEEVEFKGYIVGVAGIDPATAGKQTARLYVAPENAGSSLIGMLAGTLDLSAYPVFGLYEYEVEVNVVVPTEDSEVTLEGVVGGTYIPVAKGTSVWSNIATSDPMYFVVDGNAKTAVTSDMMQLYKEDGTLIPTTDATVFDANGNIIAEGRYEVRIVKGSFTYSFDIQVIEITSSTTATYYPLEGTQDNILDGVNIGDTIQWAGIGIQIGDYKFDMVPNGSNFDFATISSAVDGNNYTLDKNLSNAGNKSFSWKLKRSDSTSTKYFSKSIAVSAPDGYAVKSTTLYFGNTIDKAFTSFTVAGVKYTLSYENGAWVAKDADGTKLADFSATFEWGSKGSGDMVTVNADGYISNYTNEYKSSTRNKYVYYTLQFGEWSYTGSFNAYELYASDKTSSYSALEIGEKLDGFITNANRVQTGSAFKWGAQGYGIYASDGTLIVAVTVKAYDADGTDVTANVIGADGGMLVAGTYKIEYDLTYKGVNQKFFHNVAVNAPAAEA